MQIDQQLISRLEKLARLQLDEAQREQFAGDLTRILDMVDKLKELNTEGVEPLIYLGEETNPMREDEAKGEWTTEAALQNAPKSDGTFFRVPKMIE